MAFKTKPSDHLSGALSLLHAADKKAGTISDLWPKTEPTLLRLHQGNRGTGAAFCAYFEPMSLERPRLAFFVHVAPVLLDSAQGVALVLARLRHTVTLAAAGEMNVLSWDSFGDGFLRPVKRKSPTLAAKLVEHGGLSDHDVIPCKADPKLESSQTALDKELTAFFDKTKSRADRTKGRWSADAAVKLAWERYVSSLVSDE